MFLSIVNFEEINDIISDIIVSTIVIAEMYRKTVSAGRRCKGTRLCCYEFAAILFTEPLGLRRDKKMRGNY